jgi:hypothetical protein
MLRPLRALVLLGGVALSGGPVAAQDAPPAAAGQSPPPAAATPAPAEPARPPAVAISTSEPRGLARTCTVDGRSLNANELLERTIGDLDLRRRGAPTTFRDPPLFEVGAWLYPSGAPSGTRLHVRLTEAGRSGVIRWSEVGFIAAAFPKRQRQPDTGGAGARPILPNSAVPVRAERYDPLAPDERERLARAGGVVIAVNRPEGAGWRIVEDWLAVIAVCDDNRMVAFAEVSFPLFSGAWALCLALAVVAGLYLACGLAAMGLHRARLDAALRQAEPEVPPGVARRLLRALDPAFVTQDASGAASLSRLQLLLFTLAVSGVYTYIFVRTGSLSTLSESVLLLLGIAVVGGGLARLTGDRTVLSPPNRMWLTARGVLRPVQGLPRWRDLVTAGGEVDVSRLQAIAFSGFAVVALIVSGPADLSAFVVPEQLLWLIGLSQAVYVAGRAVPPETVRRANQEMDALRAAERAAAETRRRAGDAVAAEAAASAFEQARAALAVTLAEVLGERFDEAALAAAAPG